MDSLRFYLGGDIYSAENLYLWLGHYLESIEIEYEGGNITLPSSVYNVVGFEADDELLPYPKNVYQGYRIIQEYLSFPNAFLFFDLKNIGQFIPEHIIDRFTIRFVFSRTLPSSCLISDDSFVLYATPIINLFEHDSDPIDLTGKNTEHRIVPSNNKSNSLEIFSIDHVQGLQDIKEAGKPGQHRVYTPFESFQHEIELARNRVALYYRIRIKEQLREGHFEHFISFVRGDETSSYLEGEAVTIELTCTNKQKPSELGIGDINVSTSSFPPIADAENITIPTQTIRPVLDGSLLWALISNLSLNYLSLLDKSALCSVLRTYDFRSLVDHQAARVSRQRMEGIVKIESEPLDKLIKGLPVRGLLSKITMDPKSFRSEGDLYLFGMVLSRFFSLYANINSFHELVVINADSNEKYNYGDQQGIQPLI